MPGARPVVPPGRCHMAGDLPVDPGIIPSYPQFLSVFISFPLFQPIFQGHFNPTRDEEGVEDN